MLKCEIEKSQHENGKVLVFVTAKSPKAKRLCQAARLEEEKKREKSRQNQDRNGSQLATTIYGEHSECIFVRAIAQAYAFQIEPHLHPHTVTVEKNSIQPNREHLVSTAS